MRAMFDDRRKAAVQVFLGGASYGVMATSYNLAYAAGFTSNQVAAGFAWGGFLLFLAAFLVGLARGKQPSHLEAFTIVKLMASGAITCMTAIFCCYAMSKLPVPVALTLLFQFTWIGTVIQVIVTRRAPVPTQVIAAAVILIGTVLASGIYHTGIAGYDPLALLSGLGAAVCCALFVTLSGMVPTDCSTEQRGVIVCSGAVIASHLVAPTFIVSGALLQGFAPFMLVIGTFGLFLPVMLFGMGTPHLEPGISTILSSAELPAGMLVAMVVLGTPVTLVEWLGVAVILGGVVISQIPSKRRKAVTA